MTSKPQRCTCGHSREWHLSTDSVRCFASGCPCARFDQRNFSDDELQVLRLAELEQLRSAAAEAKAAKAGECTDALPALLLRIAVALEALVTRVEPKCPACGAGRGDGGERKS